MTQVFERSHVLRAGTARGPDLLAGAYRAYLCAMNPFARKVFDRSRVGLGLLLVCGVLMFCGGCASEGGLEAKAKVKRPQAEQIALSRVPGGTIKSGDIGEEHGRLAWSFNITAPGMTGNTRVAVDAMTGTVFAVDVENPNETPK